MTYECTNCDWKGEELSTKPLVGKCPTCGDNVQGEQSEKYKANQARIKEITEDILDDGKKNYSNNPKKKRPGRKSKKK